MDLRGDALRADLRRICSIDFVTPWYVPELPSERIREHTGDRNRVNGRVKAKEACRAGERRRQQAAMAARPANCMSKAEIARAHCRSIKWVETKVRALGLQPVLRNVFAWYAIADLKRVGLG